MSKAKPHGIDFQRTDNPTGIDQPTSGEFDEQQQTADSSMKSENATIEELKEEFGITGQEIKEVIKYQAALANQTFNDPTDLIDVLSKSPIVVPNKMFQDWEDDPGVDTSSNSDGELQEEKLAQISLRFSLGIVLLLILGSIGVYTGILGLFPSLVVGLLGISAVVFSTSIWYQIRSNAF